ncbi:PAS/PAC sensor-containing diguanylate cyclase/phosphodiesterase [Novosphingobium resinovorum]|nr:PAS/PAC sensor-containing diguanylate cyclase/phosphodiesterase [Novosphingobium resinovorum]
MLPEDPPLTITATASAPVTGAPTGSAPIIRDAIMHAFAAMAVAILLAGEAAPAVIVAWLAAVALAQFYAVRLERSRHELSSSLPSFYLGAVLSALAWVFPLWAFGSQIGTEAATQLWAVLAVMMAASALRATSAPITTFFFSGIVGISSAAWFLYATNPGMAAIALLFMATTSTVIVERRRSIRPASAPGAQPSSDDAATLPFQCEFGHDDAHWHWQTDATRRLTEVSRGFALATGRDPSDLKGISLRRLIAGARAGDAPSDGTELAERMKRREDFSGLAMQVRVDDRPRWWKLSGEPHYQEGIFTGYRGTGCDITESRVTLEMMTRLAHYDALTGLPNRAKLTEVLAAALDRSGLRRRNACAFLMIDLDRFKAVNDTLGHDVGDTLLARVAERLREQIADSDMCGRFSGGAFAVVIPEASDLDRVRLLVRRITDRLIQPYEIGQHTVFVGASIGWAVGPHDGSTAETIMRNADLALYRAKETRSNSHCRYERSFHAQAEERRKLEIALRSAMKRDELHLAFQPVVDAQSEAVVSFEALLRWRSTEYGPVSPEKFIPIAEETRLIVPIGEWIMHEACKAAASWPGDVRIAVNVSGEQLLDPNFVSSVIGALTTSGLAPERLEIEVTESIFLSDATRACTALEHVMAVGCTVALDDFGTGYSSLGYLRRMRFSTIKLDRSFVNGAAGGNRECLAILQAVVTMAESLGMSTTAEGVETRREVDMVRKLGCRKIQGYYFGKPADALAAQALFAMS